MSKEIVKVVGLSFRPVRVELKPKQLVTLLPEPDNKFDSDAVKVESDGVLLGYIGKTDPYRPTVLEAKEPIEVPIYKIVYYKKNKKKLWDKVEVGNITQLWLKVDVPSLKDNTYKYVTSLTGEKVQWSEFHHSCLDMDGNKLMGGSTYATSMTPQSNFKFIAKNYAKKNNLKEKQVLDYWDSLMNVAGDYGTSIHKAMEHYGKYEPIVGHEMALPRQRHLKQVVENFLLRSDMKNCLVEPLITDVKMGMSGWIDLLRVVGDKKIWIEDYKSAIADEAKWKKNLKEYTHQLRFYGTILHNHGYTVEKLVIWHWTNGEWKDYRIDFTPVEEYLR